MSRKYRSSVGHHLKVTNAVYGELLLQVSTAAVYKFKDLTCKI